MRLLSQVVALVPLQFALLRAFLELTEAENDIQHAEVVTLRAKQIWHVVASFWDIGGFTLFNKADTSELFLLYLDECIFYDF